MTRTRVSTQQAQDRQQQFKGIVEFAESFGPRPGISHVLFDFDGTLSLLREGSPEVMVPMFAEMLRPRADETESERRQLVREGIMRLNGKQTIYQMLQLCERIKERGAQPREPLWYNYECLRPLDARIRGRIERLRSCRVQADEFLVFGARQILAELKQQGFELYLASGTDEVSVKEEAALLGIDLYFGPQIYGAIDNYGAFSKKMVIERMLKENHIDGSQLLTFRDGYVEIENTREIGGFAVAVASDEAHNGSGRIDKWKRERLLGVGAQVVIPDYRDGIALLQIILDE